MRRRQINQIIALAIAITALLVGGGEVYQNVPKADVIGSFDESLVQVVEVVDGDTLKVQDQKSKVTKTVRLIGIDTPETKDPRKGVQYFGKEASQYTTELLLHRNVTLKKDVSDIDRYGRLLRYVYLGDGTFINERLVREGYARASTFPPDVKYSDVFIQAEKEAREKGKGLWHE